LARDVERELKAAKLDARDVRAEVRACDCAATGCSGCSTAAAPAGSPWLDGRPRRGGVPRLLQRLEGLRTALLASPTARNRSRPRRARPRPRGELAFLMRAEADDHVYFVETRGAGLPARDADRRLAAVKDLLFDEVRAAVLTSATLAVDGGFTYVKDRLGSSRPTAAPRSPFHYEDQAVLYVRRPCPSPVPEFVDHAARRSCASSSSRAAAPSSSSLLRQHERRASESRGVDYPS